MRSLDTARAVCERFHPGLLKEIEQIPHADRERPGSPVIDLFRIHGGVGLLIPEEYSGHGAAPLYSSSCCCGRSPATPRTPSTATSRRRAPSPPGS
ncbi:hypothetical protein ACWDPI_12010, partial [Streptomyces zhihengii]